VGVYVPTSGWILLEHTVATGTTRHDDRHLRATADSPSIRLIVTTAYQPQYPSQQPGLIDDEDCLFSIRYRQAMDAATAVNGRKID
jgi:hypothetical protein